MKKTIRIFFVLLVVHLVAGGSGMRVFAQQLPYYTQFKTNMYMLNPGITGTKRTIDARLNDRIQWVGYDGAPRTMAFSLHSRFLKGKMGAGMSVVSDKIGTTKQTEIAGNYAYHIRFPDVELSLGASGVLTKYTLDGSQITIHNTQDPAIDQSVISSDWVPDASFGAYLYNDRFHLGVSALHFIQTKAEFYKKDSTKKGIIKEATHVNMSLGYNYSWNPEFVLENTLLVNYAVGAPIMLNYTARVHYVSQYFVGASIRPKDAVALQIGASFFGDFQVSYSYDILVSKLKPYSKGSHEIMLTYSKNINVVKSKFVHQRYAYLF